MIGAPLVEIVLGLLINLVAVDHPDALARILVVQLLGNLLQLFLAAAVVAHEHDVLESALDQLLGNLLIDLGKQRRRETDRAGKIRTGIVRRVR